MQRRTPRKNNERKAQKTPALQISAIYKVNRSDELLEFLLKKCNTSRNNVKSLLTRRQVLVNGSVVTQYNFALAKDDEVKIAKNPVAGGEKTQNTRGKGAPSVKLPRLKILYEDDDFIAVDKPVGLLSVESDKERESAFAAVLATLQSRDKTARPFILHRIDKETSGVLLFAKNIKLHSMLKMKWNELVTLRQYYAVCEGAPENKQDTIVSYLKETATNLVYSTQDPSGQKAITRYSVCKENGEYALLKVEIDTGRKNQIRVHLKSIGHGVVGDEKYGSAKDPLGRLGLHASALAFRHPVTGEEILISAPLPEAFRKLF
ncbi:MAG: RluA family pseudouridine synthase [Clostridia bacterium]|nr:RluA family pseudouridine synthase [Clostridia bacterium]